MRKLLRPAAVLAAGALVATTFVSPAHAAPDDRTAGWLERQLTDGIVHNDQFDFDDYGLTADVAFGLDALGGHRATVREIGAAVAPHVDSWTTGVDFGSSDVYAGSVAKALVLAQTAGADERDFGGVDLVRRLHGLMVAKGRNAGRIGDRSETDYSNTIGQAFAALGLAETRSARAPKALRFLLKQQCSEGFFRLAFAPKKSKQQGCDAGGAQLSSPDTDVTALAVVQLAQLPQQNARVTGALKDARGWLRTAQRRNGSFGGGTSTEAPNANSTGLAAWALGETGACKPARKSARWVKRLQVGGKVGGTPFAGEKGAIAYDAAAYAAGEADGITVETRDQWRRTSSQAAPGLAYLDLAACR